MTNGEMDAIQVDDTIMRLQWALAPGFILLSQGAVETTDGRSTGSYSHQRLSHLSDFVCAHSTDKHLGQRLSHLRGVSVVALEHLGLELALPISGNFEIFNAPGGRDQIASVGP